MKKIISFFYKHEFHLYLFLILLFKLPPLKTGLLPGFLNSHLAAKGILTLLVVVNSMYTADFRNIFNRPLFLLIAVYVAIQSISVIHAQNTLMYLKQYQNLITHIMLFSMSFYYVFKNPRRINLITRVITLFIIISFGLELTFILLQKNFLPLMQPFVQTGLYELYKYNFERGRIHLYLNTELFLVFFLYIAISKKSVLVTYRLRSLIIILGLIFMATFSNFRRPVVLILFQIACFVILTLKNKIHSFKQILKTTTIVVLLFSSAFLFGSFLSYKLYFFQILDRFTFKSKTEDVDSLNFRLDSFKKTLEIGWKYPLTGVGLGQYAEQINLPNLAYLNTQQNLYRNVYISSKKNPHSFISQTIAETGFMGLFVLSILLTSFLWKDIRFALKIKNMQPIHPFVIAFWTLFIYGLFSPFDNIYISSWFWILRGVIEAVYVQKKI